MGPGIYGTSGVVNPQLHNLASSWKLALSDTPNTNRIVFVTYNTHDPNRPRGRVCMVKRFQRLCIQPNNG